MSYNTSRLSQTLFVGFDCVFAYYSSIIRRGSPLCGPHSSLTSPDTLFELTGVMQLCVSKVNCMFKYSYHLNII